jgi:hypothetical protein
MWSGKLTMRVKPLLTLILGLSIVIIDNQQYTSRAETMTLSESQRQQLRSLDAKIILPSYIPQGFHLSDVRILSEDRKGYAVLFENTDNTCFLVEGTDTGMDEGIELEGILAIDSPLFGQGYMINYGRPKDPALQQQFPEADLYSDWMKIGEYFYRLSGSLIAREDYDYPNCRQDISPSEAVKVIESFGDSN